MKMHFQMINVNLNLLDVSVKTLIWTNFHIRFQGLLSLRDKGSSKYIKSAKTIARFAI